jgi:WD40 repeat protein
VNDVAFSQDGTLVVTGGIDGTIRVWTSQGAWRDLIDPQAGAVTSVMYTSNGEILASTDGGLVAFFACGLCVPGAPPGSVVQDDQLMAFAQQRVTRSDLTCGERVEFLNTGERCQPPSARIPSASPSG